MSENDKWEETRNTVNYTSKNIFAILGLIFAFIIAPGGLILSIIGKSKASQDNDVSSAKLAKAGIIVSIVVMVLEIIAVVAVYAIGFGMMKETVDIAKEFGNM